MDFNINVNVRVSVTPETAALIGAMLQSMSTHAPAPSLPEPTARPVEAPTAEVTNQAPAPAPAPETEQPAAAPAEATPTPEPEAPKALTAEDIRAAMHRTRQRIEGEDYKDNTNSEGYKKYHRQLTGTFKGIAAFLGADKPSALPADMIPGFITACDELYLDEYGEIKSKVPF